MTRVGWGFAADGLRPSIAVLALGVATMLFIVATFSHMAIERHTALVEEGRLQNERLADSLEQHAKGTLRQAVLMLTAASERLELGGGAGFDLFLAALATRAPPVAGIRILDDQGRFLHSHPDTAPPGIAVADRDYFKVPSEGAKGIFVGAPVVSRVNGEWVLPLSTRREDARGDLLGVTVAVMRLTEFTDLYEAVRARPNGSIALFRLSDGMLLARAPAAEGMTGKTFADGPLFREHLPNSPRGSYMQVVATDHTMRLASYRALPELGVVVAISTAYADIAAEWRRHVVTLATIGIILASAVAWVTWRLVRELQHREKVELLLARHSADLELANEELRQVAQMSAHHLQEPLRTILSYSQLLIRRAGDNDSAEAAEYVEFIRQGVRRMKGLLNALQRYLALERDIGTETGPVVLDEVLDTVLEQMELPLVASGAMIERTRLPVVEGSREQLIALFTNLIEPAIQHHEEGQPPLVVGISAERQRDTWLLSITDNASGFDHRTGRKAFDLVAPDGWARQEPSLGLALCRKIVHLHGGTMRLEPADGDGVRVLIALPATP